MTDLTCKETLEKIRAIENSAEQAWRMVREITTDPYDLRRMENGIRLLTTLVQRMDLSTNERAVLIRFEDLERFVAALDKGDT